MSPQPLIYFEIQKYYQSKYGFNCVYPKDNLSKKQRIGHIKSRRISQSWY